jgi:hypothetical protein
LLLVAKNSPLALPTARSPKAMTVPGGMSAADPILFMEAAYARDTDRIGRNGR